MLQLLHILERNPRRIKGPSWYASPYGAWAVALYFWVEQLGSRTELCIMLWILHRVCLNAPHVPSTRALCGSSAGCEEREKQTYKQKQSQLKGFAPGSTWGTDLKDLCTFCRQRAIITLLQKCAPLHMEIQVLYWFKRPPKKPQCLWLKLTGWPPLTLAPMSTVSISPHWQVPVNSPVEDLIY